MDFFKQQASSFLEQQSRKKDDESRPSHDESRPSYGESRPSRDESRPSYGESRHESRPSYGESRPSYDESRPSYGESRPSYDESHPSYGESRHESRPSYGESRPSHDESRPSHGESQGYSRPVAKKTEETQDEQDAPSYQELMSSATVILNAAKSQFGGQKEGGKATEMDKEKIAAAAEDVLQAAERYGNFKGTQFEGYLNKAEEYLHNYKGKEGADHVKTGSREGARNRAQEEDVPKSYD